MNASSRGLRLERKTVYPYTHPLHRRADPFRLFLLLVDVNAGIAGVGLRDHLSRSSETVCVFVKHNVTVVLDELI